MTTTHNSSRLPLVLMYAGLALTLLAVVVPLLAPQPIEDQVRDAYPDYTSGELDDAVTAWLMILGIIGGLGVIGWALALWATIKGRRPRLWASLMCGLGLAVSLTAALTPEETGDLGLAPAYGGLLMLPCIAGIAAVVTLWRPAARLSP